MQPLVRDNIRLAATVMLIRDTPVGLEVYMVKRPGRGDFPDLHVFPGGKVDEDDFAPKLCEGMEDTQASKLMGIEAGGLRYWLAVARECFEECGVLIVHENGDDLSPAGVGKMSDWRTALLADSISFTGLCRQQGLTIACTRLGYFSHWITPDMAPRRFDTRFFIAAMPSAQTALADTGETAGEHWVRPSRALELGGSNEWKMIDPTVLSLQTLSQYNTVEEALTGVNSGNHLMPLTPELNRQGMQVLR